MATTFDGLTTDVFEFVRQFEAIAVLHEWTDKEKQIIISVYLSGAALYFYREICEDGLTYDEIIDKLKAEFGYIFYSPPTQKDVAFYEPPVEHDYKLGNQFQGQQPSPKEVDVQPEKETTIQSHAVSALTQFNSILFNGNQPMATISASFTL